MKQNCDLGPKEENIGYLLWRITKYWQRARFKAIDEFNLTVPQLEILGSIYHMERDNENISQVLLSQMTEIAPMTTSTILKNLEKKNLIKRTENKIDTRARVVESTDEGKALFRRAIEKVKKDQEDIFENIDKKAMIHQLNILMNQLERLK